MRTPEEIIGRDAVNQLTFEGYEIKPIFEFSVGDHVADKAHGFWQGVVKSIRLIDSGFAAPGIATTDTGRGQPREWNLTKLKKSAKPDFVDWL